MQQFFDGKKTWSLRWTIGVMREARSIWYYRGQERVRLNPGLPEEFIGDLFGNAELVADLVFLCAMRQHPNDSKEELEEQLYGEVIDKAREALIDELVNFSQDRSGRGKMLRAIVDEVTQKMAAIIEEATESLTCSESSTSGAESLASTETN
jgi:hypothetical protein